MQRSNGHSLSTLDTADKLKAAFQLGEAKQAYKDEQKLQAYERQIAGQQAVNEIGHNLIALADNILLLSARGDYSPLPAFLRIRNVHGALADNLVTLTNYIRECRAELTEDSALKQLSGDVLKVTAAIEKVVGAKSAAAEKHSLSELVALAKDGSGDTYKSMLDQIRSSINRGGAPKGHRAVTTRLAKRAESLYKATTTQEEVFDLMLACIKGDLTANPGDGNLTEEWQTISNVKIDEYDPDKSKRQWISDLLA